MNVAREAVYRVAEGEELTLADLGLLVAHLQTVGMSPPEARVRLRDDAILVEWSTHQETDAELRAQAEARRLEREAAARPRAVSSSEESVAACDEEAPAEESPLEPASFKRRQA